MSDNVQGKVSREIDGDVFLIGLDRASKRNAFDSHMIKALSLALTEYEDNSELRCAVIFAHGDHFTAGLDLLELQSKLSEGVFDFGDQTVNPWATTGRIGKKPLVVAVQGYCLTAGIELMLNADVVIASEDTVFAQMEVRRGILPFGGATARFVQASGWTKAMRYLLTGDQFDANTAYDLNLINEIVSTGEQSFDRAVELAHRIAKAAPLAVQATLESARTALNVGQQTAFDQLQPLLLSLIKSEDAREGAMAMAERREPTFSGK